MPELEQCVRSGTKNENRSQVFTKGPLFEKKPSINFSYTYALGTAAGTVRTKGKKEDRRRDARVWNGYMRGTGRDYGFRSICK